MRRLYPLLSPVVLVLILLIALFCMKNLREEKELLDMGWRVDFPDLVVADDHDAEENYSVDFTDSSGKQKFLRVGIWMWHRFRGISSRTSFTSFITSLLV